MKKLSRMSDRIVSHQRLVEQPKQTTSFENESIDERNVMAAFWEKESG
tara:strand:+ start:224 stop:367 length:144 start_codon:yes stop_codon:yes gene_type:complete